MTNAHAADTTPAPGLAGASGQPSGQGYYHWTLVDNFEWAEGWTLPFGLIQLDHATQARRSRPSADLYSAIARSYAITPELIDAYGPELRKELLPG